MKAESWAFSNTEAVDENLLNLIYLTEERLLEALTASPNIALIFIADLHSNGKSSLIDPSTNFEVVPL